MKIVRIICAALVCGLLLAACATRPQTDALPAFTYRGVVLQAADLKYRPHNDVIFPSVIRTKDRIPQALGKFYMYYAPHDAPGGICLAYADQPEGPWHEYANNPIITRDWPPHYQVSHVSGPDVIWNNAERRLFLYFHGENSSTRLATSSDGVHFEYFGVVVDTNMLPQSLEASYARVFEHHLPHADNRYVMLLMGNNQGSRRIYLATSKDGRTWAARPRPVFNPPPGTDQTAGAVLFPWRGKNYLVAHANDSQATFNAGFDLYAAEVDPGFERIGPTVKFFDHRQVNATNEAAMSPCFIEDGGRWFMFFNIGARLNNKIALAVLESEINGRERPIK